MIIVDDREPDFKHKDVKVKRIHIGDYAISLGGKLLILIERKTWKDLVKSILDGRIYNLLNMCKINCKKILLIEGSIRKRIGKMKYNEVTKYLDEWVINNNILIIYTKNLPETHMRIARLHSITSRQSDGADEKVLFMPQMKTIECVQNKMLRCFMSYNLSTIVLSKYKLIDVFKLKYNELSNIKYNSGLKVGSRANKILKLFKTKKCHVSFLACIPYLSKKSSSTILSSIDFSLILSGNFDLRNIKKENNKFFSSLMNNKIKYYLGTS
jgi:ERCC4-type nuclease